MQAQINLILKMLSRQQRSIKKISDSVSEIKDTVRKLELRVEKLEQPELMSMKTTPEKSLLD